MRGSVFSRASLAAPWGFESGHLPMGIFHAVVRGRAWAQLVEDGRPQLLERGDVVLMPRGDNHLMTDAPDRPTKSMESLTRVDERGMGHLVVAGEGPRTSLICGTVEFDRGEAHPVFSMLPQMVHVRDQDGAMATMVETLIGLIAGEVDRPVPGSETIIARLTDALIVCLLREYINQLPAAAVGFLGALRDPQIQLALGLLHRRPDHQWTAAELANAVGMSRSTFFARFKEMVGETPSDYLTRWRVHLGTRLLREEDASVASTARAVGYSTEAAFSNAFLRVMGTRPGAYKRAL